MTDTTETRRHAPLRSNARSIGDVREIERDGRTYLTFPTIAAKEMVMNYPEDGTRELLPADNIRETADHWSGTSIAYLHPENETKSARTANAYTSTVIGQAHDPEMVGDDRLRVEPWIDVEKAESIGGMAADVVNALRNGEELSVSAAYTTVGDRRVNGTHDGEHYDVEQGTPFPDHIAIFPSDAPFTARCSPEDGCAAPRANAAVDGGGQTPMTDPPDDEPPDPGTVRRVLNFLGVEDDEPHDDCTCDGSCDDCRQTTTNASESGSGGGPPDTTGDGPDGDEAAAASDTTESETTTMTSHDIEALAENSAFTTERLDEMDDDVLDELAQTIDQYDSTDAETTDDAEGDAEAEAEDADTETDAVTANAVDEEMPAWAETLATKDDVPDDEDIASVVRDTLEQEDLRPDAEVVANARDDLSVEDALEMPEGVLRDLAEEERTANYAAVPGPVDRTPDEPDDDADEYPSGGFSSWKQNAEGDD